MVCSVEACIGALIISAILSYRLREYCEAGTRRAASADAIMWRALASVATLATARRAFLGRARLGRADVPARCESAHLAHPRNQRLRRRRVDRRGATVSR